MSAGWWGALGGTGQAAAGGMMGGAQQANAQNSLSNQMGIGQTASMSQQMSQPMSQQMSMAMAMAMANQQGILHTPHQPSAVFDRPPLEILLIPGIKSINVDNGGPIDEIFAKHIGTRDILACQDELLDAGFKEFARLDKKEKTE